MMRFTALLTILFAAASAAAAQTNTYNILHSFDGGGADGASGNIGVVIDGSTLFGMTEAGGANNQGTIYRLDASGSGFSVLHSFAGGNSDGLSPMGGLIRNDSTLYGMTGWGGASGCGTVFKMQTDGSGFSVLHAFTGGANDGQQPAYSRLTRSGNTLYGMTEYGGSNSGLGKGTIFKVNVDGSGYTVLHSFTGGIGDGADPQSGLTVIGDTLYGTTKAGGVSDFGTLFKIGADGNGFSILHSFGANTRGGVSPCGELTLSGTTLFGTAQQGGGNGPYGTIFKIDVSGQDYTVLHNFDYGNPNDAAYSVGSLTLSGQTLYGTAGSGVNSSGILFQMNIDGTGFTRLHAFQGGTADGSSPGQIVTLDNGILYGTTWSGGSSPNSSSGRGTVYSLAVPEPTTLALLGVGAVGLFGYAWRRRRA
ncbi:MAG: choice-of-anchor tandem repeat GloVer-containing protein [Thermoguttaceae bacterium]